MQSWSTQTRRLRTARELRGASPFAYALLSTASLLTAAALCAGVASADPGQQDQLLALLEQEQIPPTGDGEVPGVVARAHQICDAANSGTSINALIDDEINRGYADNPALRIYAARVRRTAIRFITASVDVYCPNHKGELPPYE